MSIYGRARNILYFRPLTWVNKNLQRLLLHYCTVFLLNKHRKNKQKNLPIHCALSPLHLKMELFFLLIRDVYQIQQKKQTHCVVRCANLNLPIDIFKRAISFREVLEAEKKKRLRSFCLFEKKRSLGRNCRKSFDRRVKKLSFFPPPNTNSMRKQYYPISS